MQSFAEESDDFFICDTAQITDLPVSISGASTGTGTVSIGGTSTGSAEVSLDPYSTAQRSLRWTVAKAGGRSHEGKPSVLVGFVDGDSFQKQAVRDVSQEWLRQGIGVHFEFTDRLADALVRITFARGGNKSATGTEALTYGGRPTMQLGEVFSGSPARRIQRVILHEFGHGIMTFGHEHRHPEAGYRFKPDAQIAASINSMLPPGSTQWSADKVRRNITDTPYSAQRVCGPYDVHSIMHYPILPEWLTAGTPVPSEPISLSGIDVACAKATYAT